MVRKAIGKQAQSVFQKPEPPQAAAGGGVKHAGPEYIVTTFRLRAEQRGVLDQIGFAIRAATGATVSTTAIIRGLIDAIDASEIDLSHCRTEADVKAIVLARLSSR